MSAQKVPLARFGGEPVFQLEDADDNHRPLLYDTRTAARLAIVGEVRPAHHQHVRVHEIAWKGAHYWGICFQQRNLVVWRSNHSAWFAGPGPL